MRSLFLTGATGRLGTTVTKKFSDTWVVHPCSRSRGCDLRGVSPESIIPEETDFVLNCAALSSRGGCSRDPVSAFLVNTRWPVKLAEFCRKEGKRLVHISTDLVYAGGVPPYTEKSPAVPKSLYGWTKLLGDLTLLRRNPGGCVVRTSVLTGKVGASSPTFTEDILSGRAKQFHVDSFRNHTDIDLFAAYLEKCLQSAVSGLVLAAAPYSQSRAAFAASILEGNLELVHAEKYLPGDITLRPSVSVV